MKKLLLFCYIIFFSTLSALSCLNFAYDAIDCIEKDKTIIVIEKPDNVNVSDFLTDINQVTEDLHMDIMLRQIENIKGKPHYLYFKTNHTTDFLRVKSSKNNIQLKQDECISTTISLGYHVYQLKTSALIQDITIYSLFEASKYDYPPSTFFVKSPQQANIVKAIEKLGYVVNAKPAPYISGKFSVSIFGFVPAFMLLSSIVFYTLTNAKRNILEKMEGYNTRDVLIDEAKSIIPVLAMCFIIIEIICLFVATVLYKTALFQYVLYSLPYITAMIAIVMCGFVLSMLLIHKQNNVEYVRGRVPRKGIYLISILSKGVFVGFIIFFFSIAIRNAFVSYNSMQTLRFFADKMKNYVAIPVDISNTPMDNLNDNYKAFYLATVNRYNGVLIDASNYEYSLIEGKTLAEKYGQTFININRNYLTFNPIYDTEGKVIGTDNLSDNDFNVLIPVSRQQEKEKWREYVQVAYGLKANFITYDNQNSKVYSYNADTGTGGYGILDSPVIMVIEEEQIDGMLALACCSKGSYFLNVSSKNAYEELLSILQETEVAATTLATPSITSTFLETINFQRKMFMLYGTQSGFLMMGLFCLILFSAKLYCENNKRKIAYCLIEGYSILHCVRKHLFITVIYYVVITMILGYVSIIMQLHLNHLILLAVFIAEIVITLIVSQRYAYDNLYRIMKGAE